MNELYRDSLFFISAFTTLLESTIAEEHGCLHQLCVHCLLATNGEGERSPLPEDHTLKPYAIQESGANSYFRMFSDSLVLVIMVTDEQDQNTLSCGVIEEERC